jgi:hypothetical protein
MLISTTSSRSSYGRRQKGMSIVELLVSCGVGVGLVAAASSNFISDKRLIKVESVRTRLSQNLRLSLEQVGSDIRLGGQYLNGTFPAFEITEGGPGGSDTITIRKLMIPQVLTVCEELPKGTLVKSILTSDKDGATLTSGVPTVIVGCLYSNSSSWHDAVEKEFATLKKNHSSTSVFLYNPVLRVGQFLTYKQLFDEKVKEERFVEVVEDTLAESYPAGSLLMIVEELNYSVDPKRRTLDLVVNRDASAQGRMTVAAGISKFSLTATLQGGAVVETFGSFDEWKRLQGIRVRLEATEAVLGYSQKPFQFSHDGEYFPRNVLSE